MIHCVFYALFINGDYDDDDPACRRTQDFTIKGFTGADSDIFKRGLSPQGFWAEVPKLCPEAGDPGQEAEALVCNF